MWQINFCPQCGARAAGSDRFCGICGLDFTHVLRPVPPPSYDYQCTYQQWVPHSPPSNQAAAPINSERCQQRYVYTDDGTVTPISAEISKLLAELFDRRLKHNKA
jgi:hypothetical protein